MSYPAREYSGAGLATALTVSLSATDTTISVADASTWTNVLNRAALVGASGNYFTIIIDYGTVNEEKIQCSGLTNTSITVDTGGRGLDSTGPSAGVGLAHTTGASVMLCLSATEMAEINGAIQATVGNVAAIGDLIQGNGVNSFGRLAAGTAGQVLTSNGSGSALSWKKTAAATYYSASTSAPTTPSQGQMWYQTDTHAIFVYSGSAWLSTRLLIGISGGLTGGTPPSLATTGFYMQTGVVSGATSGYNISATYPTAFSTGVVSVLVTPTSVPSSATGTTWSFNVAISSKTGFTLTTNQNATVVGFSYIAFGW